MGFIHRPFWPGSVIFHAKVLEEPKFLTSSLALYLSLYILPNFSLICHLLDHSSSTYELHSTKKQPKNGSTFTKKSLCSRSRRHRPPTRHRDSRYMHKLCNVAWRDVFWLFLWLINDVLACTSEMASVGAANTCRHLSGSFRGWCLDENSCTDVCIDESHDNIQGTCADIPPRCYCMHYQLLALRLLLSCLSLLGVV